MGNPRHRGVPSQAPEQSEIDMYKSGGKLEKIEAMRLLRARLKKRWGLLITKTESEELLEKAVKGTSSG